MTWAVCDLLVKLLDHAVSLGLGPELLSIAGKHSLAINEVLTDLGNLSLLVDGSNDLGGMRFAPELRLVLCKYRFPISGILLVKLLDHMVSLGLGPELRLVLCKYRFPISGILLVKLLDHMMSLGLGPELRLVLCKYRLPISGILLVKLLDHAVSLGLGPELLSIAGKHSFAINEVLTDLGNLNLLVDDSNDLGGMRFASELCFVGCEYCFPISGILLVKLLDYMVSLGLGPELCLVLCKYR